MTIPIWTQEQKNIVLNTEVILFNQLGVAFNQLGVTFGGSSNIVWTIVSKNT